MTTRRTGANPVGKPCGKFTGTRPWRGTLVVFMGPFVTDTYGGCWGYDGEWAETAVITTRERKEKNDAQTDAALTT